MECKRSKSTSIKNIKNMSDIIKEFHIKAKKSFWQNFLINTVVLETIAKEFNIEWKNIVEVGPGYWALTDYLLKEKPASLTLVELDRDMIAVLESRIGKWELYIKNTDFEIVNQDVLKYEPKYEKYFVIANIPYYITSPILKRFLYDTTHKPEAMLILMQKEVAEKIVSRKNKTSVLSLFIQKKAQVSKVIDVKNTDFKPAPKVDSTVLKFESHSLYTDYDDEKFLEFIKIAFKEPRKFLIKNLSSNYEISKLEKMFDELSLDRKIRAEDVQIEDYLEMMGKI